MSNTRFQKGHRTWNKGIKGTHFSPNSEFKKGQKGVNWVTVGTTKVRIYHGKMRTYQKIAEPNQWKLRSLAVWESGNGKIPKGFIVHHKDRDVLNDDLSNLELLSRGDHLKEHRSEYEAKRLLSIKNMKRVDITCVLCSDTFLATKKAKFCPKCLTQRSRESGRRYKHKIKLLK